MNSEQVSLLWKLDGAFYLKHLLKGNLDACHEDAGMSLGPLSYWVVSPGPPVEIGFETRRLVPEHPSD